MCRRIVNILNFVRAVEPRSTRVDIVEPVIEEIKLNKKYHFPNTFLLQYDALVTDKFVDIFRREADENMEIGLWFECVKQLVDAAGLPWRGDPDVTWNWHVVPGFLLGYTQEERKLLIDEAMRKFKEVFGYLPKSVGSWMLDSWSVDYMSREYGIKAFAICREQFGIDAYTLWGGYSNQGYYPSKKNVLCPAQTEENKVMTPVFRMLGPDPIYNYDEQLYDYGSVPTLEAAWKYGWEERSVDAMFHTHFEEECMDFGYATIGQENGFGWEKIQKGLPLQLGKIDKLAKENQVVVEKLCDTGEWFRNTFRENPVVSMVSNDDYLDNDMKSIWYNCPAYRANLLLEKDCLYFRDINLFDENYQERYLDKACETWNGIQDNLPVVDGRLWNGSGIRSGLKFDTKVSCVCAKKEGKSLVCTASCPEGEIKITFAVDRIIIHKPESLRIYFERGCDGVEMMKTDLSVEENSVHFLHNGYCYEAIFDCRLSKTAYGYELGKGIMTVNISF